MNVVWIGLGKDKGYFAFEEISSPTVAEDEPGRWARLRNKVQQGYQRMLERFDHVERLFAQLRHAQTVTLVHSTQCSGEEVQKKLERLARVGYSKHTSWLVVDALLACAGGILAPLPGPNIFFFYPAIRTMSHHFARKGALKVRTMAFQFKTDSLLDELELSLAETSKPNLDTVRSLEERYNLKNLEEFLKAQTLWQ